MAKLERPDCRKANSPHGDGPDHRAASAGERDHLGRGRDHGPGLTRFLPESAPHDILYITGGSIGQALPVATGAAVAAPDRKIVTISGDGGAMYTLQSLWTQAREKLDVVTVICANRSYAILNIELARVGAGNAGPKALSMLDIGRSRSGLGGAGARHGRGSGARARLRGICARVRRCDETKRSAPDRSGPLIAFSQKFSRM